MAKFGIGARVIDLLGRQQVAGTPTAISELFKNAHDAYARNVEVDFYRAKDLFIIRDDGVGMSREDFEARWLTAATDSKRESGFMAPPETDLDQEPRPVMGEKGIGRLSIAVLGRQVLVMTRRKTHDNSASLIAALLHWSIFTLPNVGLADLEIPVRELPGGTLPDAECIHSMVTESTNNLQCIRHKTDVHLVDKIIEDLAGFDINPAALATALLSGPDLRDDGHGTHFYITPTFDALALDIDMGKARDKATPMEKALLGFSNTMVPGHKLPPMATRFRDHGKNGLWRDLIAEDEFFTPAEYEIADHRIAGKFDEYGQFYGFIQIYGGERRKIQIRWPDAAGKKTRCGPFKIDFAYVQGAQSDSRLSPEVYAPLAGKLNRIGGLYLYRDGMRILPYGDSDYDFLDIEGRRTKGAAYYFFSYRRMFGVIEISRNANSSLIEKAGREGFQENSAYKQFNNILQSFFVQIAAEFFREDGSSADAFMEQKNNLNKAHELLEKRKKQIAGKRRQLKSDFDKFFGNMNKQWPDTVIKKLYTDICSSLESVDGSSISMSALRQIERDARARISDIDTASRIVKPRGVGLTKEQTLLWARYEVERRRLAEEVFRPTDRAIQRLVQDTAQRLGLSLEARNHAIERLVGLGDRSTKRVRGLASEVQVGVRSLQERVMERARQSVQAVAEAVGSNLVEFERRAVEDLADDEVMKVQADLESAIEGVAAEHAEVLTQLAEQLSRAAKEELLDDGDLLEALETELEDRRARELESLELAQMGQAIGIVHHEFHSVIRSVRTNVRRLAPWAEKNQKLSDLYRDITESYAHLDSYLSLFAPLNRRLSQTKRIISGKEIYDYLQQLLGDRMQRHDIHLVASDGFITLEVNDFVSTLYPAFVNIVDNALFWITYGDSVLHEGLTEPREKRIVLDYVDGAYLISDTGPGVLPADEVAIFESGFSRKPNGSGLGLHITRSILERNGYALTLDPFLSGTGATFRIHLPAGLLAEEHVK